MRDAEQKRGEAMNKGWRSSGGGALVFELKPADAQGYRSDRVMYVAIVSPEFMLSTLNSDEKFIGWTLALTRNGTLIHNSEHSSAALAQRESYKAIQRAEMLRVITFA